MTAPKSGTTTYGYDAANNRRSLLVVGGAEAGPQTVVELFDAEGNGRWYAFSLPQPGNGFGPAIDVERRFHAMGTELRITVQAPDRAAALGASEAAYRSVQEAEQRLSTWTTDSELSRVNQAPVGFTKCPWTSRMNSSPPSTASARWISSAASLGSL